MNYSGFDIIGNILVHHIMNIKVTEVPRNKNQIIKPIQTGFILCNHRSWFDLTWDWYYTKSSIVSRGMGLMVSMPYALLGLAENRIVWFNKGDKNQRNRQYIFNLMLKNIKKTQGRIAFYPEGTRNLCKITKEQLEKKGHIRWGCLKSVYEYSILPCQLFISSNKDVCINEKSWSAAYGCNIKCIYSNPILPTNHITFIDFQKAIIDEWWACEQIINNNLKIKYL